MKRILLVFWGLMSFMAMAQHVDEDETAAIAAKVLGKSVTNVSATAETRAASILKPFYNIYVGADGDGFVIVSTDRRAPKVIGYGDSKVDANNLPPQLKAILEKQDSVLLTTPGLSEHSSWKQQTTRADSEGGKLLKTANWGQGYPYNLMTPEIDGKHCPTGCGPTAMAIIMKYHAWPEKGRGKNAYIIPSTGEEMFCDFSKLELNWDTIPNDFVEGQFTDEQATKVAEIMNAIGCATNASYTIGETGIWNTAANYNLYRFFKYKIPFAAWVQEILKSDMHFDDEELIDLMKKEIDENRPMLFSGNNYQGGHMFVIDGYDNNNLMHINWGWDGYLNGFFSVNDFYGYNVAKSIITYINPDYEATEDFAKIMITEGSIAGEARKHKNSLQFGFENMQPDVKYPGMMGEFTVTSDINCEIAIALTDKKGEIKELSRQTLINFALPHDEDSSVAHLFSYGESFLRQPISFHNIEQSDLIQIVYREIGEENWHIMLSPDFAPACVPVTGNEPPYVNVTWDVDEKLKQIDVWNVDYENHSKVNGLLGSIVNIFINGDQGGIVNIFVNGKDKTYKMLDNRYTLREEILEDMAIEIKFTKYSDLLDFDIYIDNHGNLKDKVTSDKAALARKLVLHGEIDKNDIDYINDKFSALEILDLGDTKIYPDNCFPEMTEINSGIIRRIILPKELKGFNDFCFTSKFGHSSIVDIPKTVEFLGEDAFLNADINDVIVYNENPIKITKDPDRAFWFATHNNNPTLYVPFGSKDKYSTSDGWKEFPNIVEYENSANFNKSQEINWEQDCNNYAQLERVYLFEAQASSELPVQYVILENSYTNGQKDAELIYPSYESTKGNGIKFHRPCSIVVEAQQTGNAFYNEADPVRKTITFKSGIIANYIELNRTKLTLNTGDELLLVAKVYPENAADKTVTWYSSDENVATVSADGLVTAVNVGTSVIMATCGKVSATCKVTVNPILVESIELNPTNYSLQPEENLQLVATVLPENATNKDIVWSSSNEEVVKVDSMGLVSFVNFGDAIVTATATDGSGVSATCTFSNVDGILTITPDEKLGLEIYTIDGKRVEKVEKGMNIIQTKDGKVKKVYVK